MLRVLHILDHSVPLHSGYSFRTLSLLNEQRRLGWQTAQLTSTKHYGAQGDIEEVDGYSFYRTRSTRNKLWSLPVLDQVAVVLDTQRRLTEVIDLVQPDILHAHSPSLNGIAALRAIKRSGKKLPLVYEMRASWEDAAVDHGSTIEDSLRYKLSRRLESSVLRRADAVTTICDGLRHDILSRGIAPQKVTIIPNGVDIDRFPLNTVVDAELRAKLNLDGAFVLGFIGSYYGYEGIDLVVDALPSILQFEPNAKLLLVGGGNEEAALKAQVARLNLSDKVIFVGRVPHADVSRYYSVVDLLVYARKSMRLTEIVTPLKPLEAMAQGQLLAASNVGGHRELIEDGKTGFLFPADDPQQLARAVKRVCDARADWQTIRMQGRQFVEAKRTWTASAAGYVPVYESLLGRTLV